MSGWFWNSENFEYFENFSDLACLPDRKSCPRRRGRSSRSKRPDRHTRRGRARLTASRRSNRTTSKVAVEARNAVFVVSFHGDVFQSESVYTRSWKIGSLNLRLERRKARAAGFGFPKISAIPLVFQVKRRVLGVVVTRPLPCSRSHGVWSAVREQTRIQSPTTSWNACGSACGIA